MGYKTTTMSLNDGSRKNVIDQGQDWEVPTEVHIQDKFSLETINTEMVSKETVSMCAKCGFHNHLKDNSCIRCDRGLI